MLKLLYYEKDSIFLIIPFAIDGNSRADRPPVGQEESRGISERESPRNNR